MVKSNQILFSIRLYRHQTDDGRVDAHPVLRYLKCCTAIEGNEQVAADWDNEDVPSSVRGDAPALVG